MNLSTEIQCHSDTELNYFKLLVEVSKSKMTIMELATAIGLSDDNTQRMIKKLQTKGYVNKIFAGKCRYVSLTDRGKNAINSIQ